MESPKESITKINPKDITMLNNPKDTHHGSALATPTAAPQVLESWNAGTNRWSPAHVSNLARDYELRNALENL